SEFDINDMLQQVNRVRSRAGAKPLQINQKLMQAAQNHSADQAKRRQMSHTGSDGSTVLARCQRAGYKGYGLAENVAYNQRTITAVMNAWIKSPGHYRNLVNPSYQDLGAGMVNYYWTQNFGSGE
ncbi:hypothetical protein L0F63_000883, partial [Massospora cicadina]